MFGQGPLDLGFERRCPAVTPESAALVEQIAAAARRENREAAARLTAIADLFALRSATAGPDAERHVVDTVSAVAAEVAAALNITHLAASAQVGLAKDLRDRLPLVAAVFAAGDITERVVETLVHRTALVVDLGVLARIDAQLAAAAARLPGMSYRALLTYVDRIVGRLDPDGVRRRKSYADKREVWVSDQLGGMSLFGGMVASPTAHAWLDRLTALAGTVCDRDPRTLEQRRADAMAAMTLGADRMACHCQRPDCPAREATAAPVVLHLITDTIAVNGGGTDANPAASAEPAAGMGVLLGADGLLPPEVVADLAAHATIRPVVFPGDAPPEAGYTPSTALAEYVRCRDLTCRFPGCKQPAVSADIDHTIPHAAGGPTQAANLKCLCRAHHLLKTFGGWTDQQLPDGTVIWTSPAGDTYLTTPGSALIFPTLCAPTAPATRRTPPTPPVAGTDRLAKAPQRRRTRAEHRAAAIAAERAHNHQARIQRRQRIHPYFQPTPPADPGDDPPPF
ncbi:HNH endonuclease [Mycobacterium sp. PS03-16]|uniref:HNH endonuclease signature motif containing protein n=1 Tax=Mycobacterium sp. PS03-16 TaxID=2559611 RepID=UPI001073504A|nr:HNH endonuclease signature motif containing protein [Mycobacterium sp. PS03-16]TFV57469.1 HNH endonuclease [Mycobacterium sp. PS03-16]